MDEPADVSYVEICAVVGELYLKLRVATDEAQRLREQLQETEDEDVPD